MSHTSLKKKPKVRKDLCQRDLWLWSGFVLIFKKKKHNRKFKKSLTMVEDLTIHKFQISIYAYFYYNSTL